MMCDGGEASSRRLAREFWSCGIGSEWTVDVEVN